MPLSPRNNKPGSSLTNLLGKHESTSQDPKHNSSGSNVMIMDKRDRSGSDPTIMEYTAEDATVVVPQYPKYDSSGSNSMMTYKHDRSDSDPMITEYTVKDAPAIVTLNVNTKDRRSQGNRQSTYMNDEDMVEEINKT